MRQLEFSLRHHRLTRTISLRCFVGKACLPYLCKLEKTRFDFNLKEFNKEVFLTYIDKANELFKQDIPVKWYDLAYDEAMKIPTVSRMAGAFPPNLPKLRIVEIAGVDKQADGGTHVHNLKEVGQIEFIKAENKGKNNRRVYFRLID